MALPRGASVLLLAVLLLSAQAFSRSDAQFGKCTQRQLDPNMYGDGKAQLAIHKCASEAIRNILATKRTPDLVDPDNPASPANAYVRFEGILLRAAFHDAGTWDCDSEEGGANGSLRLPEESGHPKNGGLQIGIEALVKDWEAMKDEGCGVSFADLLQIGGAEACFFTGLPRFMVPIGRHDVDSPDLSTIDILPGATMNIKELKDLFGGNGYNLRDLVSLSGAHTIGVARTIQPPFGKPGFMDGTPDKFDNVYYDDLVKDGCQMNQNISGNNFCSDSTLLDDLDSTALVVAYRTFPELFFKDFISAYIKMGKMGVNAGGTTSHI